MSTTSNKVTITTPGTDDNDKRPMIGHPKVLQAYIAEGLDPRDEYEPSPEEIGMYRFEQKRDPNKALRRQINQIYRMKVGNREYLMYNEIMIGEDKIGNKDTHPVLRGRYNHPEFTREYDNQTGRIRSNNLLGTKVEYEIPFSPEKLLEIYNSDTENSDPALIVAYGRVKYAGMFSIQEFMHRSFDDLMTKGQTGRYPPPPQQQQDQQHSEAKQIKEAKRAGGSGLVKEAAADLNNSGQSQT